MSNKLVPTELPENHVEFAKELAEAAKKHGIEEFTLEYKPKFDMDDTALTFWGKLKVLFSAKDGRGRPANNLSVVYETQLKHVISETPESMS